MTTMYKNEEIVKAMFSTRDTYLMFKTLLEYPFMFNIMLKSSKGAELISQNADIIRQIVDDVYPILCCDQRVVQTVLNTLGECTNKNRPATNDEFLEYMINDAKTTKFILDNCVYLGLSNSTNESIKYIFTCYFTEDEENEDDECRNYLLHIIDSIPDIKRFILTINGVEDYLTEHFSKEERELHDMSKDDLVSMIMQLKQQK